MTNTAHFTSLLALLDRIGVPRAISRGNDKLKFQFDDAKVVSIELWSREWDESRAEFFWATCTHAWTVEGEPTNPCLGDDEVGPSIPRELAKDIFDELEYLYYVVCPEVAPKQTFSDGSQLMLALEWESRSYRLERLHEAFY